MAYAQYLTETICRTDEFLGEDVSAKLIYYPSVTREPFKHPGRVTDLIESGKLFADIGLPPLDPAHDRMMICGSQHMLDELKAMLLHRGFTEGNSSHRRANS